MFHEGNRNKETGREWQKDIGKIWNTSNWNSYILLRCAECEYNIGEPTLSPSLPLHLSSLPAHIINLQRTSYTTVPYSLASGQRESREQSKAAETGKTFCASGKFIFTLHFLVFLLRFVNAFCFIFLLILFRHSGTQPLSPSTLPLSQAQHRPLSPLLPF